jgi:hypothetical protein
MLKRFFYSITAFTILSAFITKDDPIDRLINSLQQWSKVFPQEKVYLLKLAHACRVCHFRYSKIRKSKASTVKR